MEQERFLFPENILRFERPAQSAPRRQPAGRMKGEGLAQRLRRDVERQIAHRRRMLSHLESQSRP